MSQGNTALKVSCFNCGEIELDPARVRLIVCAVATLSRYQFECPRCERAVERHADEASIQLLVRAGVIERYEHAPVELLERRDGLPLSWDEVLDFHLALRNFGHVAADVAAGKLRIP